MTQPCSDVAAVIHTPGGRAILFGHNRGTPIVWHNPLHYCDNPVRRFVPGVDMVAQAGAACDDARGSMLIEGAGYWVQQEAPNQTDAAPERFLGGP